MSSMKNQFYFLVILLLIACQNTPKTVSDSPKTDIATPSVLEQKTTDLAVQTMPDSVVKPFLRKPLKPIHPIFGLFAPPVVRDAPISDTIKSEISRVKPIEKTPIPANFFQKTVPKSQFFTFDMPTEANEEPSETIVLTGKEGTKLTIGKNVFETENGKNTEGGLRLELKEFYKMEDIIAANLTTQSDGEMLETGGMIYLSATDAKGQKLTIKSGKSINIQMPRSPNSTDKQLFYGEKQADSTINWRIAPIVKGEFGQGAYRVVDENPEFRDGQKAMFTFISNKIRYPKIAYDNGIEGTVYVGFVVSEYGEIEDVRVLRGIHPLLNREAVRVINLMPLWAGGRNKGKPVKVAFTLPIKFKIDDATVANAIDSSQYQTDSIALATIKTEKLRLMPMQQIENYVFETQQLGWINCDRLVNNSKPKTAVKILCNSQYSQVNVVLKNFKSVLKGYRDTKTDIVFQSLPIGEPVVFIVTYADESNYKATTIETIIEKNQTLTPDLQTITPDLFFEKLKTLNFTGKEK
jgi:TonB family protein